jgi:hypothetical protein
VKVTIIFNNINNSIYQQAPLHSTLSSKTTQVRNPSIQQIQMSPLFKIPHQSKQIVHWVKISGERLVALKVTIKGGQITSQKREMNSSYIC